MKHDPDRVDDPRTRVRPKLVWLTLGAILVVLLIVWLLGWFDSRPQERIDVGEDVGQEPLTVPGDPLPEDAPALDDPVAGD